MTSKKVAVITRTSNRPILLRRAIESVLGQRMQDWIHVVINDGGERGQVEDILGEYRADYGDRLQFIHIPGSIGMQNASNVGIRTSESEYIAIHDDDDQWDALFLEKCAGALDNIGQQSMCYGVICQSWLIQERMNRTGLAVEVSRESYLPCKQINLFQMSWKNPFPPISFLYRRQAHDVIGYFDQRYDVIGDWDFNIRFVTEYDILVLPDRLALYHIRCDQNIRHDAYGNTVLADVERHIFLQNDYRNHQLRRFIKAESEHLGLVVNTANAFLEQKQESVATRAVVDNIQQRLQGIERRIRGMEQYLTDDLFKPVGVIRRVEDRGSGRVQYEKLLMLVENCSCLSLDVFDTCLFRSVAEPSDVFSLLSRELQHLLKRPGFRFDKIRVEAERNLRARDRQAIKAGEEAEPTIEEIYAVFCTMASLNEAWLSRLVEMEFDLEKKLCHANPLMLSMYRSARDRGKQIVFSTDSYWSADRIRELLRSRGYEEGTILVSSGLRLTKHTGRLFGAVVETTQCKPESILHIGDNYGSDYVQARKNGLNAFCYRRRQFGAPFYDQVYVKWGQHGRDLLTSIGLGLSRKYRSDGLCANTEFTHRKRWRDLGYEVAGPLTLCYLAWIVGRAVAVGIDRLCFLSRDGYYLQRAFDFLNERWQTPLRSRYLMASRRALNFACFSLDNPAAMDFILAPHPHLKVADFFERIGLNAEPHADLCREHGFPDLKQIITQPDGLFIHASDYYRLRAVFETIRDELAFRAEMERQNLLAYLHTMGVGAGVTGMVDLGWQASSIASLTGLLRKRDSGGQVHGFYFGTWKSAARAQGKGASFESFYCHLGAPTAHAALLMESVALLEFIFSAPHPMIVGMIHEGTDWKPVYQQGEDRSPEVLTWLEQCWSGADAFLNEARTIFNSPFDSESSGIDYIDNVLQRILREPTIEEAGEFGAIKHAMAFGGKDQSRIIASVPDDFDALTPKEMKDAYLLSQWKAGFLAGLSDEQIGRLNQVLQSAEADDAWLRRR